MPSPDVSFAFDIMPMYIESARAYAQLATGALALSIAFKERVLGQSGRMKPGALLIISWLCLLFTIGASAFYQWVAVRLIELINDGPDAPVRFPLTISWLWPGPVYGAMLAAFFLAAVLLVFAVIGQLHRSGKPAEPTRNPSE